MLKEKLAGPTLGQTSVSASLSASDWVKSSRSKAKEDKLLAQQRARMLEEQDKSYTSQDMKGVVIGHSLSDLASTAGETILTLKDTDVLDCDEHGTITGLNEGADELVNVNMVDVERFDHLKKVKDRARMPMYNGLDDGEFEIDPSTGRPRATNGANAVTVRVISARA